MIADKKQRSTRAPAWGVWEGRDKIRVGWEGGFTFRTTAIHVLPFRYSYDHTTKSPPCCRGVGRVTARTTMIDTLPRVYYSYDYQTKSSPCEASFPPLAMAGASRSLRNITFQRKEGKAPWQQLSCVLCATTANIPSARGFPSQGMLSYVRRSSRIEVLRAYGQLSLSYDGGCTIRARDGKGRGGGGLSG